MIPAASFARISLVYSSVCALRASKHVGGAHAQLARASVQPTSLGEHTSARQLRFSRATAAAPAGPQLGRAQAPPPPGPT